MEPINATKISTEQLIQFALDAHVADCREDLPYTNQDGTVLDDESLRLWLIPSLGMWGV